MALNYKSGQWDPLETTAVVISGPVVIGGNVTVDSGNISIKGNVTLTDSKGFIGLVTVANIARTVTGNVTLSDAKTFIGLATVETPSYTATRVSSNTTIAALGAAGILKSIVVGQPSLPTITIYDSAVPSGTVLLRLGVNYPLGTHEFNAKVANGVTIDATAAGGTPELLVLAK